MHSESDSSSDDEHVRNLKEAVSEELLCCMNPTGIIKLQLCKYIRLHLFALNVLMLVSVQMNILHIMTILTDKRTDKSNLM